MTLLLSTLLLSPLAANPSLLDGTWHLVAVEEDGQAFAPGTATLPVRRGRFEALAPSAGGEARRPAPSEEAGGTGVRTVGLRHLVR
jgi:hypothetical protein